MVFILENETGDVAVDPAIINRLRGDYEQFYTHKFDNLLVNKMDQLLQKHKLSTDKKAFSINSIYN